MVWMPRDRHTTSGLQYALSLGSRNGPVAIRKDPAQQDAQDRINHGGNDSI